MNIVSIILGIIALLTWGLVGILNHKKQENNKFVDWGEYWMLYCLAMFLIVIETIEVVAKLIS